MELTEKLKHTSSSRLTDRIKSTEAELGKLVSAHDQAESDAVSKAGEDVAYQKAAARAGELGRQVAEKRERLDRLRTAHAEALDREQEELIADLRSKHQGLVSVRDKVKTEVERLRAVEEARHKKETDHLDRRLAEAELAEAEADIALQEEVCKSREKEFAEAEAAGDRDRLRCCKGSMEMQERVLQRSRADRGTALEKIAKLDQP